MSIRFDLLPTPLAGLMVIRRKPVGDARGYLERLFCAEELAPIMGGAAIQQINRTLTVRRGTVRGMHLQRPPHAEKKLVSCLRGEVFDVAVDLRAGSRTFGKWHAEVLSEDNGKTLAIPEGFAHGFQTIAPNCEMLYFHSAAYEPGAEFGVGAEDPVLAIAWPETITELSARDASHPRLPADFRGVAV